MEQRFLFCYEQQKENLQYGRNKPQSPEILLDVCSLYACELKIGLFTN